MTDSLISGVFFRNLLWTMLYVMTCVKLVWIWSINNDMQTNLCTSISMLKIAKIIFLCLFVSSANWQYKQNHTGLMLYMVSAFLAAKLFSDPYLFFNCCDSTDCTSTCRSNDLRLLCIWLACNALQQKRGQSHPKKYYWNHHQFLRWWCTTVLQCLIPQTYVWQASRLLKYAWDWNRERARLWVLYIAW